VWVETVGDFEILSLPLFWCGRPPVPLCQDCHAKWFKLQPSCFCFILPLTPSVTTLTIHLFNLVVRRSPQLGNCRRHNAMLRFVPSHTTNSQVRVALNNSFRTNRLILGSTCLSLSSRTPSASLKTMAPSILALAASAGSNVLGNERTLQKLQGAQLFVGSGVAFLWSMRRWQVEKLDISEGRKRLQGKRGGWSEGDGRRDAERSCGHDN
jgi:hypothetical protein